MRHVLLTAARALADGQQPPAVGGDLDFASIRGAEKILEPGEDWRPLGTNADPVVQEALGQHRTANDVHWCPLAHPRPG
jgi:phthalate 4,5-dioxygenase